MRVCCQEKKKGKGKDGKRGRVGGNKTRNKMEKSGFTLVITRQVGPEGLILLNVHFHPSCLLAVRPILAQEQIGHVI